VFANKVLQKNTGLKRIEWTTGESCILSTDALILNYFTDALRFKWFIRKPTEKRQPGRYSSVNIILSVVVKALCYKLEGRGFKYR
jgi:hypothetical protein